VLEVNARLPRQFRGLADGDDALLEQVNGQGYLDALCFGPIRQPRSREEPEDLFRYFDGPRFYT
jgi:hypothetical protein